ncbi:hypothetical protein CRENBAI_000486 [Crenichthys baileyi]|uniref:Tower domain-containing protein n=1 Tax=Crenichthys baileyi TaxID=28760 RepID=A0AAV9S968_9TELE
MDYFINNMYDGFKDEIWEELGPLDPHWFEVLTAQASLDEGNVLEIDDLCANQEGHFKAPVEKPAAESQLFSTPKVFRHRRIVSSDTEDEPSFTAAQDKETLPWTATQSPCLFQVSKHSVSGIKCAQPQREERFDVLDTPKASASYAKHISESLGAQINPDISWTSSLNTPPALPSTLILSRNDESPCPVSVAGDRNVVFVRKLFPSLSNFSFKTPKKSAVSSSSQGAVFPVASGCPDSPLKSESHWQQKVPDAAEGEEVCRADGPKNAPSDFFANSSLALRKVKPDRIKRKQIMPTNVDVCSREDLSEADNGGCSDVATANLESGGLPSTPLIKTGDPAISQWSPLSLSEISSCSVGSNMTLQGDMDSVQLPRPSSNITDSGFIRKKRKFVYIVAATKSQVEGQDSEFQKMGPSPKPSDCEQEVNTESLQVTPAKAECRRTENQRKLVGETITSSVGTKLQDIDMSQLCRDFAQEFSQMPDFKIADDTQSNFSPAACLSAMKQAKQKAMQENLPNACSSVCNNRHMPTSCQPCSVGEGTMFDSGFQTGVADITHMTSLSFGLPHLENVGQSRPLLGFKTAKHDFPSTNGSGKVKVDTELPRQRSSKGQTPDHGKEIQLHIESTSTRQSWCREKTADDSRCGQPERTPGSLPSSNASGFKTASNKGIRISFANLERAKRLFEETEDRKTLRDHGTETNHAINVNSNFSPATMKNSPTNSNPPPYDGKSVKHISSQLTASEKADVTELCTLLEEADSQFEFTQYKPAKNTQNHQDDHNPQQIQDSGSDGGKHPAVTVMNDKIPSVVENRTNGMNKYTEMSVSASLDSLSENISEDRKCLKLGEPNILPGTKDTSELENNSTVMHGEAFRTAEGNVLKVSKKCLSKARALLADLENNLTDQKPSVKQNKENAAKTEQKCNVDSDVCKKDSAFTLKESCDVGNNFENCFSKLEGVVCSSKHVVIFGDKHDTKSLKKNETDTIMCESGFRMASGKGISISARFMQEADAFFKDCHVMGHEEDKNIKAPQPPPENAVIKKSFSNLKSQQVSISKESGAGCTKLDDVNAALIAHHTKGPHLDEVEMDNKFTPALKNEDGKPSSTSKPFSVLRTSKSIDSSAFEELCPGDGFCTATGKNIFVSAAAMRKAESLLNQIHTPEEINNHPNQKEKTSKCHSDESSKIDNGGFLTVSGTKSAVSSAALKKGGFFAASGKPVVLSSEAWEKAKALFSDISLKMDNVSETAPARRDKKHEKDQSNAEIIHNCDFTTAGAVKDHVSQKSLLKVKDHLKECDHLVLAKAMQEEDALFTDLGSNSAMLDSVSKKEDLGKPFPGQKVRINFSEEVGKGCFRDTEQQKVSCGFKTASGGRVDVSFEALKRAETLLGDCVGVEEKRNAAPPESKAITLPLRNGGFQSASGKPVLLSSESLGKAKSLFSDISLGAEDPNISQTRISSKNQDSTKNTEKICCGFTTARGEKVDVLQKNLQKAKVLFKELDDLVLTKAAQDEDAFFADCDVGINNEMLGKDTKCKVNVGGSKKATVEKCYPDDKMRSNISMEAGCSRDVDKQVEQREDILPQASREFQTASGKRVAVLSEALKRAETVLREFEGIEDKTNATLPQFKATAPPLRNGGFHSASGKPIALSTEAVEKAKSFFGNITFSAEDPDFSQTKKTDGKQGSENKTEKICCGFTTARGEKVDVSQKNLQKAKFLFKELDDLALTKAMQDADDFFKKEEGWTMEGNCEILSEQTNKIPVTESGSIKGNMSKPNERETGSIYEEPKNGSIKAKQNKGSSLPMLNGGFQTASGKTVTVSCEALSKSKLLLSENKADEDRTCVSLPLSEAPVTDPGLTNGGFFAASGKPVAFSSKALQKAKTVFGDISLNAALPHTGEENVHMSEKSLLKANNLLREPAKWEGQYSFSRSANLQTPVNPELSNVKNPERTSTLKSSLTSANRKNHSGVKSFLSVADSRSDSHEEVKSRLLVCDLSSRNSIKTSEVTETNESSDPELQSLNLTGCTETQHRFFAQEALDCTKALLEDEVLVGRTLLTTAERFQLPEDQKSNGKSTEEDKRRKRRSAEDVTAQPPSKRRLLEEFARTTDGPRSSGLHPVKSCPNGLMDRGVFKYSASHHPNVTKPHSLVDARLQRSTQTHRSDPGGGRSAPSKMPAFVPPFIKNSKRDIPKNPEAEDRKRAPAFVPPFKKQRVVLQEGSLDQQEANKQHRSLLLESNSNKDAPLTKNSQSSTDVIPSVNSSITDIVINQSVPVNVRPVSSTEMLPVDDRLSRSQDMTQNIELARDMQDMRIRKKKRQTIRPLPGNLFLTKTSGVERIPLKVALNGRNPGRYSAQELYEWGVHKHVPEITCGNAESFRFNLLQFVKQETLADGGGVQLADGGWLIPSNHWTAGKEEFYKALCDTSGVDPKLISQQWVYNHYKWIVWKQASMEKSFPETIGSLCLTPDQVLLQLKYRYDVEVDHSRRPALRKIMERDDTPAKTLVLCVCEIVSRGHSLNVQSRSYTKTPKSAETKVETQFAVIQLTDGWYAIKAQLDEPLTAMLHKGQLAVGGKLIIHGAQLVGSQDACSPLEAPDSLMLKWMERKSDGGVVFRSARAEEKEARRFNSHKQKAIEMLFAKVQAEFEKEEEGNIKPQRRRQTISKQDIGNLQDGEELYEAVGDDPADLETHLNEQQLETLRTYRCSRMEKKQAELQDRYRRALEAEEHEKSCPKRDVTPVWRLCIADSRVQSSCVYQLNLWRPSSDLQSLLKEGCRFKVYNLVASDGKKRSSVEPVQLTGTKKTQFQELQASQEWLSSRFQQRVSTNFVDLQNEEFKPLCGDVDLIGYVISVIDQQGSSPAFYLVDGKLNFVKVRCFCSLSQAGLEDVLKPRVLLALSNLQLRGQSIYPTPVVYAGDLTAFSTNPKEIHLQESFYQLKNLVQCQDNFFLTAEEKLAHIVKSDGMNSVCSPSSQPQTPVSATDRRQDSKTSVTFQKPVRSLGSFTPVSSNRPAAKSSAEKDPKSLKRKTALDYLSRIPSPPPVSPLGSVVPPCVNKTFNPPRRSGTTSTLKPVQTAAPKPADSLVEDEWVNDEELAMIDTQALHVGSLF